jgi:hypothetical protein
MNLQQPLEPGKIPQAELSLWQSLDQVRLPVDPSEPKEKQQ